MPTSIEIIHPQDFIRAMQDGTLDLAASRRLLMEVVAALDAGVEHQVLIDTRAARARLPTAEIYQLGVAVASEPRLRHRRIALLVPPEEEVDAGFFETVSRNRGVDLGAFTQFEAAITWLIMKGQP